MCTHTAWLASNYYLSRPPESFLSAVAFIPMVFYQVGELSRYDKQEGEEEGMEGGGVREDGGSEGRISRGAHQIAILQCG